MATFSKWQGYTANVNFGGLYSFMRVASAGVTNAALPIGKSSGVASIEAVEAAASYKILR